MMIEKIEYIKSIFKFDVDNSYLIKDIAEELVKIEYFDDFRGWLKVNINHLDAQYMKPFQKFTFLIRMYKKQYLQYINKDRISKSKQYASELANKVKQVSVYVEERGVSYEKFKIRNDKNELMDAFTSFEITQLEKLGGLFSAVQLQKSISGCDALRDKLEELGYEIIVTNALEYKPIEEINKNISNLLVPIAKKI